MGEIVFEFHESEAKPWMTFGFGFTVSIRKSEAVFTLGDARSFSGLTSKIQPLGSC